MFQCGRQPSLFGGPWVHGGWGDQEDVYVY
jgi:hypothetical protein